MEDGDDRLQALLGLTGMMFTNKFQTICSVKGGNYKGFARADMFDHFGGSDVSTRATSLFSGFDGGAPPQGEYLYQRNGMATLNGILRTDSFTTMKVNADYSYHSGAIHIFPIAALDLSLDYDHVRRQIPPPSWGRSGGGFHRPVQAHVPLQCLRTVQVEAVSSSVAPPSPTAVSAPSSSL